jgi:hypothetical protein
MKGSNGLFGKVLGALVNWIRNLEQNEGFMCKTEWTWADL